jgi:hypothetical protein
MKANPANTLLNADHPTVRIKAPRADGRKYRKPIFPSNGQYRKLGFREQIL